VGGLKFNRKAILGIDGLFSLLNSSKALKSTNKMELWVMFSSVVFWSTLACTHLLHMLLVQPKFGHLLHDALLVLIVLRQLLEPMYNKFHALLYSAKHSQTWTNGNSWKSCGLWTY